MILQYAGYNTTYSAKCSDDHNLNLEESSRACFASSVNVMIPECSVKSVYNIKIFLKYPSENTMHYVFITKDQMEEWLKELQQYYPFEYNFNNITETYLYIEVSITGNRAQHLFVLSGIRYIYEVRQNIALLLSFKAKQCYKELQEDSLLNLCTASMVVLSALNIPLNSGHSLTSNRCICVSVHPYKTIYAFPHLVDKEAIKHRLSDKPFTVTDVVCPTYDIEEKVFSEEYEEINKSLKSLYPEKSRSDYLTSDFWENAEIINVFMPIILKVYNKLNSFKKI